MTAILESQTSVNERLSNRFIALDPGGYFIISVDPATVQIIAEHYDNTINEQGLAVDPNTGEIIACRGGEVRRPTQVFKASTAKELCIEMFEQPGQCLVTQLDHAAYLGREFIRAERALADGVPYIQD
jgi:dihydropteroate synthase